MLTLHQSIHSHHFKNNSKEMMNFVNDICNKFTASESAIKVFKQFMEDSKLIGYWKAALNSGLGRFEEDWSSIKCKGEYLTFAWDTTLNEVICFWSNDMLNPLPDNGDESKESKPHPCTCDIQQLTWGNGCTCKGI
jgi:hypothetical protein